jgi:Mrp family chromosome partitioning ATPase
MILSTSVDAVILVARADFSSREVMSRAKTKLQNMRANVVGVVINGVPISNYEYYNNAYYRDLEKTDIAEAGSSQLHLD